VVGAEVVAGRRRCRLHIESQHDVDESACGRIEETTRIGDERSTNTRGPIDRRRIPVERVEVDRSGGRRAVGTEHLNDVVDGLDDEPVTRAEALVGWLDGELVSAVGEPLVEEVETLEVHSQLRVRLGLATALHGAAIAAYRTGEAAIGYRAAAFRASAAGLVTFDLGDELRVLDPAGIAVAAGRE